MEHPLPTRHILATEIDDGTLNITRNCVAYEHCSAWVPSAALVGLRINVECKCDSPVNVPFRPRRDTLIKRSKRVDPARHHTRETKRVVLSAQQTMIKNSSTLSGDQLATSSPFHTDAKRPYGSEGGGLCFAVIFLNAARKEITRMELPIPAGTTTYSGACETDKKRAVFSVDISGRRNTAFHSSS